MIHNIEIEEFQGDKFVTAALEFIYHRGEAPVRYYADGSGYPGCPAYYELIAIHDIKIEDVDGNDLPLDEYREAVEAHIYENEDKYAEEVMEDERGW